MTPTVKAVLSLEAAARQEWDDATAKSAELQQLRPIAERLCAQKHGPHGSQPADIVMGQRACVPYVAEDGLILLRAPIYPLWVTYLNFARDALVAVNG